MLRLWREALADAQQSKEVRAIVITGAGQDFCAGGDLNNMRNRVNDSAFEKKSFLADHIQTIPLILETIDKPVIAAVNGSATGAGMDMALMCDIRFAEERSRFAERYIGVGIMPGAGGAWFLPRIVGKACALDLLWTGRWVLSDEALALGIVSHVVPDGTVLAQAIAYAQTLAKAPPITVRYIKRAVQQSETMDLRSHLDLVSSHMAVVTSTQDYREALESVVDKRPATYIGR